MLNSFDGRRLEAVVEVGGGSMWTVTARSLDELTRNAQDIIGSDLTKERYYVREATVDGVFSSELLFDLQARLRG